MIEASRVPDPVCRRPDEDEHEPAGSGDSCARGPARAPCALDIDWNDPAVAPSEVPAEPIYAGPPSPGGAGTNAARTSARNADEGPYAAAGYAKDTQSHHAGVAFVKGVDPKTGLEVENLSASVQVGAQNEAQVTAVRIGTPGGQATGEAFTANAHVGIHNADGSTGVNLGAQANGGYGEHTIGSGANSVTMGAGVGTGAEASIGVRDKDGNGQPEVCGRLALSFWMVGGCVEIPVHIKM